MDDYTIGCCVALKSFLRLVIVEDPVNSVETFPNHDISLAEGAGTWVGADQFETRDHFMKYTLIFTRLFVFSCVPGCLESLEYSFYLVLINPGT